jgi:CBS domain-containing protein
MALSDEISLAVNWNAPGVDIEDSLRVVIKKMIDAKASALVAKVDDDVVGVITDMDVLLSVDAGKDLDETKASSVMTACELIDDKGVKSPCVQLDSTETVDNALGVMAVAGVHNLLVSGGKGEKSGMVSIRDLLRLVIS